MVNWTPSKVKQVISECRAAGRLAAKNKLDELAKAGPKWAVTSGSSVVGTMLDVCGFASLKIAVVNSFRGKFYLTAKRLSESHTSGERFMCSKAYYGGGHLAIFDMTMRQEMSVNAAAYYAAKDVLATYGIDSTVITHID